MLKTNDPIGYDDVVGDDFDDEMGAFEDKFGRFEELDELVDIEAQIDALDELDEDFDL